MSKPARGKKPKKTDLKRLYINEKRSIRNIAALIGCSKDMVYRALNEYKIQIRDHTEKRSQLHDYDLPTLKKEIKIKGFNQVATELGVYNMTLRRYIEKTKLQR